MHACTNCNMHTYLFRELLIWAHDFLDAGTSEWTVSFKPSKQHHWLFLLFQSLDTWKQCIDCPLLGSSCTIKISYCTLVEIRVTNTMHNTFLTINDLHRPLICMFFTSVRHHAAFVSIPIQKFHLLSDLWEERCVLANALCCWLVEPFSSLFPFVTDAQ